MNPIEDEDIRDISEGRPVGPLAVLVLCLCLGVMAGSAAVVLSGAATPSRAIPGPAGPSVGR